MPCISIFHCTFAPLFLSSCAATWLSLQLAVITSNFLCTHIDTVNRGSHGSNASSSLDAALPVQNTQTQDTTDLFGSLEDFEAEPQDNNEPLEHGLLSTAGEIASSINISLQSTSADAGHSLLASGEHASWFADSLLTNVDLVSTKLPWEQGIFAELLNDSDGLADAVPKIEISAPGHWSAC